MAQLRKGFPNGNISKDCRVILKHDEEESFWLMFGLTMPAGMPKTLYSDTLRSEVFPWIRSNTKGLVYHVEYFTDRRHHRTVWEFFFQSEADAMLFRLRFG